MMHRCRDMADADRPSREEKGQGKGLDSIRGSHPMSRARAAEVQEANVARHGGNIPPRASAVRTQKPAGKAVGSGAEAWQSSEGASK